MTNNQKGYTLMELMISVVIIAILSGITITVMNQGRQIKRAQDASNLANMEKLVTAVESFYYSEGYYPLTVDDPALSTYVNGVWPEEFSYLYDSSSREFAIFIQKELDKMYYKYISTRSKILECQNVGLVRVKVSDCVEVLPE